MSVCNKINRTMTNDFGSIAVTRYYNNSIYSTHLLYLLFFFCISATDFRKAYAKLFQIKICHLTSNQLMICSEFAVFSFVPNEYEIKTKTEKIFIVFKVKNQNFPNKMEIMDYNEF